MKPQYLIKALLAIMLITAALVSQRVTEGIALALESRFFYAVGYQLRPPGAP